MNASFQVGLKYLSKNLLVKLDELIPPEWIFKNKSSGRMLTYSDATLQK